MPDATMPYIPPDDGILDAITQAGAGYMSQFMGIPGQARVMPSYFTDAAGYDPFRMQQLEMQSRMRDASEQKVRQMMASSGADTASQALRAFGGSSRKAERYIHDMANTPMGSQVLEGLLSQVGANPLDVSRTISGSADVLYANRGGRMNSRDPMYGLHQMSMGAGSLAQETLKTIYNDPMTGQMNFLKPNLMQTRGLASKDFMEVMYQGIQNKGNGFSGAGATDQGIIKSTQNIAGMAKSMAKLLDNDDIKTSMKALQDLTLGGAFKLDDRQIATITQQINAVKSLASSVGVNAKDLQNIGGLITPPGLKMDAFGNPIGMKAGSGAGYAQTQLFAQSQVTAQMAANTGMTLAEARSNVEDYNAATQGSTLDNMRHTAGAAFGMGRTSKEQYAKFLAISRSGSPKEVAIAWDEYMSSGGFSAGEAADLNKDQKRVREITNTKIGLGGVTLAMDAYVGGMSGYTNQLGKEFADKSYTTAGYRVTEAQDKYGIYTDTSAKGGEKAYMRRVLAANKQNYFGKSLDENELQTAFNKNGRTGVEDLLRANEVSDSTISTIRDQGQTDYSNEQINKISGDSDFLKYNTLSSNSGLRNRVGRDAWAELSAAAKNAMKDNSYAAKERLRAASKSVVIAPELQGAYGRAEERTKVELAAKIKQDNISRETRDAAGSDPIKAYVEYSNELEDMNRGFTRRDPLRKAELEYRMSEIQGNYSTDPGAKLAWNQGIAGHKDAYTKKSAYENVIRDMDEKEFYERDDNKGLTKAQTERLGKIDERYSKLNSQVDSEEMGNLQKERMGITSEQDKWNSAVSSGRMNAIKGQRNKIKMGAPEDDFNKLYTQEELKSKQTRLKIRAYDVLTETVINKLPEDKRESLRKERDTIEKTIRELDSQIALAPTEKQKKGLTGSTTGSTGNIAKNFAIGALSLVSPVLGGAATAAFGGKDKAVKPDDNKTTTSTVNSNSATIIVSGNVNFKTSDADSAKSNVGAP